MAEVLRSKAYSPLKDPKEQAEARIAEIDAMFERAIGWGSWMVEAANEREALATKYGLPHKHQARTADGGRVD